MKFIIIAAVSVDGVIGIDNEIPWHIPEDFKHFKQTTIGNMVLVGHNTYLTLPDKALEGREYIVLNGNQPKERIRPNVYQFENFDLIHSVLTTNNTDVSEVYVAGGAMIYESLIKYCDEAIITWVNINIPNGNKRFPIDNLFANFVVHKDNGWVKSKNNILYKITHYRRV